jgi:chromosome segregation ATPase|tara:strand:+ start:175 stop:318 length:144 start_codon:yes stop_codon:yes gene_type:complete
MITKKELESQLDNLKNQKEQARDMYLKIQGAIEFVENNLLKDKEESK